MARLTSKSKRLLGLSTKFKHKRFTSPVKKINGPKTFKTEEAANKWAAEKGIKGHSLKKVKKDKKFQIVPK